MYVPRYTLAQVKQARFFSFKGKTLFVLLALLTFYHQHILCDLVVVFGSPCVIGFLKRETESPDRSDVDGEPSESEPTFTPPGSLPRVEELPEEHQELHDFELDVLEAQQFSREGPENIPRESWADQQDQPYGGNTNANLLDLDLDEEGAAIGAPGGDDPEPVVQGPPNYNIFHGESPPRLIETKEETCTSGAAPSAPESTLGSTAKKEEQSDEPALPVDSGRGSRLQP